MQLSFMTNILVKYGMTDFEAVTRWASENGLTGSCLRKHWRNMT